MTDPDIFAAQRRVDDFRGAVGPVGAHLSRSVELDILLDVADAHGWPAAAIGAHIGARLPKGCGPGLVILRLGDLARTAPPRPGPDPHAVEAVTRAARPGYFRQPLRPCGECDASPARWREVPQPEGYRGQAVVEHCDCWTAPPGYVSPGMRNRWERVRLFGPGEQR